GTSRRARHLPQGVAANAGPCRKRRHRRRAGRRLSLGDPGGLEHHRQNLAHDLRPARRSADEARARGPRAVRPHGRRGVSDLVVVEPGFLSTVQDLGRPGHAIHGVPRSGAADPIALRVGNRLAGNDEGAAAIEMTLAGGTFRFEEDAIVARTGADAGADAGGTALRPWRLHRIRAGEVVRCGTMAAGARAYLCPRGGLDLPRVFGSIATHLAAGLGGLEGRPLRAGDRLPLGRAPASPPMTRSDDPAELPGDRE